MAAIPGSYYDNQSAFFVIPSSSIANMQPLDFMIGGTVFTMDVAAQLIPVDQNTVWGGNPGLQYGTVGPLGHFSGQGFDFILGQKFLEKYYAVSNSLDITGSFMPLLTRCSTQVFDGENSRVGLAYT
jgi:hypothetical protein